MLKFQTNILPYEFLDGVENLHRQLYEAERHTSSIIYNLMGGRKPRKEDVMRFQIFVDFSEPQPKDRIRGYFMYRTKILRFLPIEFDIAVLFPVSNYGENDFKLSEGIYFKDIQSAKDKKQKIFIWFIPLTTLESETKKIIYNIEMREGPLRKPCKFEEKIDDIGLPFYNFSDINQLAIKDIPLHFLNLQFTLKRKEFYAPYTTKREIHCILFAELDNPYDEKAIKVLRWLPMTREKWFDTHLLDNNDSADVFFELGYVSENENQELHDFMVSSSSRLLFGKVKDNIITIIGGIKMFFSKDLNYPNCLFNIPVK